MPTVWLQQQPIITTTMVTTLSPKQDTVHPINISKWHKSIIRFGIPVLPHPLTIIIIMVVVYHPIPVQITTTRYYSVPNRMNVSPVPMTPYALKVLTMYQPVDIVNHIKYPPPTVYLREEHPRASHNGHQ